MRVAVEELQKSICGFRERHEALEVKDLRSTRDTSSVIIRRDLKFLSGCQMVEGAYGGAVAIHLESAKPPYAIRDREMEEEKQQIGLTAASLVGRRGMNPIDTVNTSSHSFGASPFRKTSPPSSTGFRLPWS